MPSSAEKGISRKGMQQIASHRPPEKEHSSEEETLHEDMPEMWSKECSDRQEMQEMQKHKLAVEEARKVSLVAYSKAGAIPKRTSINLIDLFVYTFKIISSWQFWGMCIVSSHKCPTAIMANIPETSAFAFLTRFSNAN